MSLFAYCYSDGVESKISAIIFCVPWKCVFLVVLRCLLQHFKSFSLFWASQYLHILDYWFIFKRFVFRILNDFGLLLWVTDDAAHWTNLENEFLSSLQGYKPKKKKKSDILHASLPHLEYSKVMSPLVTTLLLISIHITFSHSTHVSAAKYIEILCVTYPYYNLGTTVSQNAVSLYKSNFFFENIVGWNLRNPQLLFHSQWTNCFDNSVLITHERNFVYILKNVFPFNPPVL